jgi:hypothetical protein
VFVEILKSWGSLPNLTHLAVEVWVLLEAETSNLLVSTLSDVIPRIQFLELWICKSRGTEPMTYSAAVIELLRRHADSLLEASVDFHPSILIPQILDPETQITKDWKAVDDVLRRRTGLGLDRLRFRSVESGLIQRKTSLRQILGQNVQSFDGLDELRVICWPLDRYSPSASLADFAALTTYSVLDIPVWVKGPLEQYLMRLIDDGEVNYLVLRNLQALMRTGDGEIKRANLEQHIADKFLITPAAAATTATLWKEMVQKVLALNRNSFELLLSNCFWVLLTLPLDFYCGNPCQLDLSALVNTSDRLLRFVAFADGDLIDLILRAVPYKIWFFHRSHTRILEILVRDRHRIDERKKCIDFVMDLLSSEPDELQQYSYSLSWICPLVEHEWLAPRFGRLSLKNLSVWTSYMEALMMPRSREVVLSNIRKLLDTTLVDSEDSGAGKRLIDLPSVDFAEPVWIGVIRYSPSLDILAELVGKLLEHCKTVPQIVKTFVSGGSTRLVSRVPFAELRDCLSHLIAKSGRGRKN